MPGWVRDFCFLKAVGIFSPTASFLWHLILQRIKSCHLCLTIAGALLVTKIKWASGFEKNYHFHHPTESDWQAILIAWRTCLKFFFTDWTGILKSFHSLFQCFNKNIVSQASLFLRKIAPFLSFLQLFTELYESKNSSALSGKEFKEYVLPHHTCSFLMWERMKQ